MIDQFRQPGSRVRDYQIGEMLGMGGFAVTYEVYHIHLGKHFAIKEYFPAGVATRLDDGRVGALTEASKAEQFERGLERFLREARTLVAITHPNVVQVRDVFVEDGTGFMVMDFVDGDTLEAAVLRDGPMTPGRVRTLLDRLSEGLSHVHDSGFLHRDIKPSNIIIRATDNEPVLIDFGAAKALETRTSATTQFVSHGYSPLEMNATRLESGPWTDLYSLCAVAWFALKGKAPPDAMAERFSAEQDPLESLTDLGGPWIQLYGAIDAGLGLYPKDRPQSLASWRKAFIGNETRMADPAELAALNANKPPAAASGAPSALPVAAKAEFSQGVALAEPVTPIPSPVVGSALDEGKPRSHWFMRQPTSLFAAALMAAIIVGFCLSVRLADATPDYRWDRLFTICVISASGIAIAVFAIDRLVQWIGQRLGGLAWWAKGLHFLVSPLVAIIAMLVGLFVAIGAIDGGGLGSPYLLTVIQTFGLPLGIVLGEVLIQSDSIFILSALTIIGLFTALPIAYFPSFFRISNKLWANAMFVAVPSTIGFVAPFMTVDERAGLQRLARLGYFVLTDDVSYDQTHDIEDVNAFNAAAIRAYQQSAGLDETGSIDGATWRSLLLQWPRGHWTIDPRRGHNALHLALAIDNCRPACSITLMPGEIDLADYGPEYADAFLADSDNGSDREFSHHASPSTFEAIEFSGAGNDSVLSNGSFATSRTMRVSNMMFRNVQIEPRSGAHLTNVTVEAPNGQSALGEETGSFFVDAITLERATLVSTGAPAMHLRSDLDDSDTSPPTPVTITDSRIIRRGRGNGFAISMSGRIALSMTNGGITNASGLGLQFENGLTADLDGVEGACVSANSRSDILIRRSNLTQCGDRGVVVRARTNATVRIEDDTALPATPDTRRFDARGADIFMR